jgi:hypothetical protein
MPTAFVVRERVPSFGFEFLGEVVQQRAHEIIAKAASQ